ncbi:hypothetical protein [Kitasatospora sp. NBC_01300]|uniref:hypothetical protein n=1 Tax=Kitasatospora sp. NBC_01300 TaxID=2903574 RepID=UPI00352F96D0|nr:hypothetical protein OG556_40080 [Kitasatospora sp. NBC_01300]
MTDTSGTTGAGRLRIDLTLGGPVIIGETRSGKTSAVDLMRAQCEATGTPYEITEDGSLTVPRAAR